MSTPGFTHYCSLCNRGFRLDASVPTRCPYCLRTTGVGPGDAAQVSGGSTGSGPSSPCDGPASATQPPIRRRPSTGLAVLLAALVVLLGGAGGFLVVTLRSSGGELTFIQREFDEAGLSSPLGVDTSSVREIPSPPDQADRVTAWFTEMGCSVVSPGPDRPALPRHLSDLMASSDPMSPVEALTLVQWVLFRDSRSWSPCEAATGTLVVPFSQRTYGVCHAREGTVEAASPLAGSSDVPPSRWSLLSARQVAARFAAVSGESSDAPKDVYGWYHLALRLDDDPGILFQLGVQKVRLGVADFGVEDMRSALALRQDANGFRGLGQVLLGRLQRPQEALDAFEKALELAPGDAEARSGVAQSWLLLGEDEKAKTELDALLAAAPETPGLHGALAQYWVRKEDKEKAIEALRTEVRLHPSVPSVLWLAEMEKQAGRLEAAADLLDRSYREMGVPDLALAKIVITAEQGKDKEALVDLDALLKAHPQEQKLWLAKGHLAQRSGALEQAEQAFMEASRLAPDRPLLLVPLVVTRYRIEHSGGKGQLSALDTARLLLKADSDLLIAAASELASVGQASHARQILELAVAESPSRIRPAAALFGLLTRQGETAEASRLKEQILGSLSPEERPLFLQLVEPMTQQ